MYKALLNGETFFLTDTNEEAFKLISGNLSLSETGAGTATLAIAPTNIAYDDFELFTSYVDIYRDDNLLFSGRAIDISKDAYMLETITCEGLFAAFNDSVFRPVNFNGTLQQLIEYILTSHNAQVEASKQIVLRSITVSDNYVYRAYENVESSMQRLMDLRDSYGGYMQVEKVNGILYFDWLSTATTQSTQTINFGENLLDITQVSGATDIITVLVPQGAEVVDEITGVKSRVNISSVNNGNDYIENATAIARFGRIVGVNIWDDITTPVDLKTKAEAYLNSKTSEKVTINVTAADLAGLEEVEHFKVGTLVKVISSLHGLNRFFEVKDQSLNLLDPSQDRMQLGEEVIGLIGKLRQQESSQSKRIDRINSSYADATKMADLKQSVTENSTLIEQNSQSISTQAEQITTLDGKIEQQATRITQTAEGIEALVEENNRIATAVRIDSEGVHIGREGDSVSSLQDNSSYKFIDSEGNKELLRIDTEGIHAPTIEAKEQVEFSNGSTPQWAIRRGIAVNGKHNLNDVWIGG